MTFADYKRVLVGSNISLLEAVKSMNSTSMQILLIVDEDDVLQGVVTDGDIRRALLEDIDFSTPVSKIMGKNPITLPNPPNKKKALTMMKKHDVNHIPLTNDMGRVCGLLLWKDFFNNGDSIDIPSNPISRL